MRYLVISPCEDSRTGVEFETGHEFLPEPDAEQAKRLIDAGCLRAIPDDAPILPGTLAGDAKILALEEDVTRLLEANDDLRGKLTKAAIDAGAEVSAAKGEIEKLTVERDDLRVQLDTANSRVADLEKSATQEQNPSSTEKPAAKTKASA
ncbi:hypothetical protein [Sphingomonas hankookensis]